MCGIAGFLNPGDLSAGEGLSIAEAMSAAISSRGPDDHGTWVDDSARIALAHRRLSILDLSPAGHQPMTSESGRHVLVFNGEIYNHLELRAELDIAAWRGHSDTETLLAAVTRWGLDKTLSKLVGMFAFALWDRETRTLHLARDRLGEKPLYFGWQGRHFMFASEINALRVHRAFLGNLNRRVLPLYLRHGYIPAPYSIYADIWKLPPGTSIALRASTPAGHLPSPNPYWSLGQSIRAGIDQPFQGSPADAVAELETRLSRSIGLQMVADVPLGAFLSGGIDSSVVSALMQAQSTRKVKTFTIGFSEPRYDEAVHAKAVAAHLGTEHTELYVSARDALDLIPQLPGIYDEPFGDASALPTILLSRLARTHVTVSLSGDGGDELFGGYSRYVSAGRHWGRVARIPAGLRRVLGRGMAHLPTIVDRYPALPEAFSAATDVGFYRAFCSQWPEPEKLVTEGTEPPTTWTSGLADFPPGPALSRMMYADTMTYLPDDVLCKVDRAAMSISLETRVPLLDHRIVEFAWTLPPTLKVRNGQGKWVLRQVLNRHVPSVLTDRPKMGFGVPVGDWLRGSLRTWANDLLSETRLRQQGFLRPEVIRRRWQAHLSGKHSYRDPLWVLLMFQAWLDQHMRSGHNLHVGTNRS